MEASIGAAVIGALSAIAGASASTFTQLRLMRENNRLQINLQSSRLEHEKLKQEQDISKRQLIEIHKALSHLSRQFSLTAMDIHWRAQMSEKEFDQSYMEICESLDEVRAVSALYFPPLAKSIENMYGEMNMFWGNFKELLRLESIKEPYEKMQLFHQRSLDAAQNISSQAVRAKTQLISEAKRFHPLAP